MDNNNSSSSDTSASSAPSISSVVAEAPAQSMGVVYQTMAHSLSISMQNEVTHQNGIGQVGTAVVSKACAQILAIGAK